MIEPTDRLDKEIQALLKFAKRVRKRAFAPYSRYRVGCAISDEKGRVHTGCNVENVSYSLTQCAERSAIAKMVSRGGKSVRILILMTSSLEPSFPCGACLQVLSEFSSPEVFIYTVDCHKRFFARAQLKDLLPFRFTRERLLAKEK